jgi:WD40 repeat protein
VAELAAPIRGVPKEELESEDLSQHRRALRLARAAVATLAVLTVVAVVAAVLAITNANESESRRVDSLSRELAARSLVLAQSRPDAALNVAVAANEVRGTTEARSALLDVLSDNSRLERVVDVGSHVPGLTTVQALAFGPNGMIVANGSATGESQGVLFATSRSGQVRILGRSGSEFATLAAVAGGRFIVDGISSVDAIEQGTLRRLTPGQLLAVNPAGTRVVVVSGDETRIVDLETGTVLWRAPGRVFIAELSNDATRVAIASPDDLVHVVDIASGREVGPPIAIGEVDSVAWTARGELVVISSEDDRVVAVAGDSTETPRVLPPGNVGEGGVMGISPDGSRLAYRGQDSTAVWDLAAGTILWTRADAPGPTVKADAASGAAFSADGSHLLDVALHGATLSDAATGTVISREPDAAYLYPDPSGRHAMTTGARTVLWDLVGGVRLSQFHGLATVAWAPDGSRLVTSGATTLLWDLRTDVDSETLLGADVVSKAAFSADGARLAAVTNDGHLLVWRAAGDVAGSVVARSGPSTTLEVASRSGEVFELTNEMVTIRSAKGLRESAFQVGPASDLLPLPDGRRVITERSGDDNLTLWDARSGTVLRTGTICGTTSVRDLLFSGDGRRMATTSERSARICDARGRTLRTLRLPANGSTALFRLSTDGSRIAYAVGDQAHGNLAVRVVDTRNGALVTTISLGDTPGDVAFSATRLVISTDSQLTVLDLDGDGRFSLPATIGGSLALADHGKIAVIGETINAALTNGSRLRLYDLDARRAIGVLDESTVNISELTAPREGPQVLALGEPARSITTRGSVVVRQAVTPATLLDEACRLAGGPLSKRDWARLVPGTDYVSTCTT